MLRKIKYQPIKKLDNNAMYIVEEKEVLVKCVSPVDGSEIGERKEFVSVRKEIDPVLEVAHDTSDMYDIETMQSLGVTPITLVGSYISDRLTSFESVENASSRLLDEIDKQEYIVSLKSEQTSSNNESFNNESNN